MSSPSVYPTQPPASLSFSSDLDRDLLGQRLTRIVFGEIESATAPLPWHSREKELACRAYLSILFADWLRAAYGAGRRDAGF